MQKKLADYFRILIEQKDALLTEYYETSALLRSEEAVLITGLLFSLNVVDCNLCLKVKQIDNEFLVSHFIYKNSISIDKNSALVDILFIVSLIGRES